MKNNINSLTSLRFFAALFVFLDHYIVKLFFPHAELWANSLAYLAITFFFILSGFVLSYAYLDLFKKSSISCINFYIKRFARIWPVHLVCLLMILPFTLHSYQAHPGKYLLFLLFNMILLHDFVPHAADLFNGPSWSISAEMFFYLCFPFIIVIYFRTKNFFFLVLGVWTVSLVGAIFVLTNNAAGNHNLHLGTVNLSLLGIFYVFPILRLIDFCFGVTFFHLYTIFKDYSISYRTASWLELSVLLFSFFAYMSTAHIPLLFLVDLWFIPTSGLLILIFSLQRGLFSKFLNNKYLIILGEISFAFYLLQKPLNLILQQYLPLLNPYLLQSLHFIILLFTSIFVHKYIEWPCNQLIKLTFTKELKPKSSNIASALPS